MNMVQFSRAYKLCVETCMGVKSGEKVLIITDLDNMDRAEALAMASYMADAEPIILCQPALKKFAAEPPETISDSMKRSDVVLVALPFLYSAQLFHTGARRDAVKAGARFGIVHVTNENADITKQEILETRMLTERITALLSKAETARVRTKSGTDITMSVKGRKPVVISSLLDKRGDSGTIPDYAEAAISPMEGASEGIVVIDGSMNGLEGVKIKDPIILKVKAGKVVEISGKEEAKMLRDIVEMAGDNANNLAELGIGTVKRGKIKWETDDKRLFGTGHVAIGDNRFGGGNVTSAIHLDGVFMNMTLELDGKVIMEDGALKI
jgi:leucyl aminopeptidase (aminopeptidase T)